MQRLDHLVEHHIAHTTITLIRTMLGHENIVHAGILVLVIEIAGCGSEAAADREQRGRIDHLHEAHQPLEGILVIPTIQRRMQDPVMAHRQARVDQRGLAIELSSHLDRARERFVVRLCPVSHGAAQDPILQTMLKLKIQAQPTIFELMHRQDRFAIRHQRGLLARGHAPHLSGGARRAADNIVRCRIDGGGDFLRSPCWRRARR